MKDVSVTHYGTVINVTSHTKHAISPVRLAIARTTQRTVSHVTKDITKILLLIYVLYVPQCVKRVLVERTPSAFLAMMAGISMVPYVKNAVINAKPATTTLTSAPNAGPIRIWAQVTTPTSVFVVKDTVTPTGYRCASQAAQLRMMLVLPIRYAQRDWMRDISSMRIMVKSTM